MFGSKHNYEDLVNAAGKYMDATVGDTTLSDGEASPAGAAPVGQGGGGFGFLEKLPSFVGKAPDPKSASKDASAAEGADKNAGKAPLLSSEPPSAAETPVGEASTEPPSAAETHAAVVFYLFHAWCARSVSDEDYLKHVQSIYHDVFESTGVCVFVPYEHDVVFVQTPRPKEGEKTVKDEYAILDDAGKLTSGFKVIESAVVRASAKEWLEKKRGPSHERPGSSKAASDSRTMAFNAKASAAAAAADADAPDELSKNLHHLPQGMQDIINKGDVSDFDARRLVKWAPDSMVSQLILRFVKPRDTHPRNKDTIAKTYVDYSWDGGLLGGGKHNYRVFRSKDMTRKASHGVTKDSDSTGRIHTYNMWSEYHCMDNYFLVGYKNNEFKDPPSKVFHVVAVYNIQRDMPTDTFWVEERPNEYSFAIEVDKTKFSEVFKEKKMIKTDFMSLYRLSGHVEELKGNAYKKAYEKILSQFKEKLGLVDKVRVFDHSLDRIKDESNIEYTTRQKDFKDANIYWFYKKEEGAPPAAMTDFYVLIDRKNDVVQSVYTLTVTYGKDKLRTAAKLDTSTDVMIEPVASLIKEAKSYKSGVTNDEIHNTLGYKCVSFEAFVNAFESCSIAKLFDEASLKNVKSVKKCLEGVIKLNYHDKKRYEEPYTYATAASEIRQEYDEAAKRLLPTPPRDFGQYKDPPAPLPLFNPFITVQEDKRAAWKTALDASETWETTKDETKKDEVRTALQVLLEWTPRLDPPDKESVEHSIFTAFAELMPTHKREGPTDIIDVAKDGDCDYHLSAPGGDDTTAAGHFRVYRTKHMEHTYGGLNMNEQFTFYKLDRYFLARYADDEFKNVSTIYEVHAMYPTMILTDHDKEKMAAKFKTAVSVIDDTVHLSSVKIVDPRGFGALLKNDKLIKTKFSALRETMTWLQGHALVRSRDHIDDVNEDDYLAYKSDYDLIVKATGAVSSRPGTAGKKKTLKA